MKKVVKKAEKAKKVAKGQVWTQGERQVKVVSVSGGEVGIENVQTKKLTYAQMHRFNGTRKGYTAVV